VINGIGSNGGLMHHMQGMNRLNPQKMFNRVDANKDGGIDASEFKFVAERISEKFGIAIDFKEVFAQLDENSDGLFDQEEMKSLMTDIRNRVSMIPRSNVLSAYGAGTQTDSTQLLLKILSGKDENENQYTLTKLLG
jgi:hypothetical protein